MDQGTDMDPVTMRPVEEKKDGERQRAHAKEVEQLRQQARFAAVNESEAADRLRQMLWKQLYDRICKLLQDDEAARAYMDILNSLNEQADLAARAANKLARYKGA